MGWLIFLAVVVLIGSIPLGASVRYDAQGICVKIIAGLIRFTIIPWPKKKKDTDTPKKKAQKKPSSAKPAKSKQEASQKGGSFQDFLPLVKIGLDFLNTFRKKLRVNILELKLFLTGEDPCDLAVNYGRVWASLEGLVCGLERVVTIQRKNIQVDCDFTADQTTVIARLDLTVTVGRLMAMAVKYGYLVLKELLVIKKKRKGGAAV